MSFTDPQTVTVDSTPFTLNRIKSDGTKSVYETQDGSYRLTLSHQEAKGGRVRRMARLDHIVIAADPLTAELQSVTLGAYAVVDEPQFGFTDGDIDNDAQALFAWLTTANVTKLLGNQH